MTYKTETTFSDSVNLGSNPSSPATANADVSGASHTLGSAEKSERSEQTAHTGRTEVGTAPVRIQRRRLKGWKMPPNTVYVGRSNAAHGRSYGRFGNPCRVGMWKNYTAADAVCDYRRWIACDPVVRTFDNAFGKPPTQAEIESLRGKNLACWCRLCDRHEDGKPFDVQCADCAPCHADPLGVVANA